MMKDYNSYAFGNTTRDIILKQEIREERATRVGEIENIRIVGNRTFAAHITVDYDENLGKTSIKLINADGSEISKQEIDLPIEEILVKASLDLVNKRIDFYNQLNELKTSCDITALIKDYTNKIETEESARISEINKLTNSLQIEIDRAKSAEADINLVINGDRDQGILGIKDDINDLQVETQTLANTGETLDSKISDEITRAQEAEKVLTDNLSKTLMNRGRVNDGDDLNNYVNTGIYQWNAGDFPQNDNQWVLNTPLQNGYGVFIVKVTDQHLIQELHIEDWSVSYKRSAWKDSNGTWNFKNWETLPNLTKVTSDIKVETDRAKKVENELDLGKLDKVEVSTDYSQVYAANQGSQKMLPTNPYTETWSLPIRDSDNNFEVNIPMKPRHTANKEYVDNKLKTKADLDEAGRVPSSQLPAYVDDIIEFRKQVSGRTWQQDCLDNVKIGELVFNNANADYVEGGTSSPFYKSFVRNVDGTIENLEPVPPESGKIYISISNNLTYRWSGSSLVEVSKSLALGETSSTAYAGNKGKKNSEDIAQNTTDIIQTKSDITLLQQNLQTTNTQVDTNKEDIAYTQDYLETVEETVTANKNNIDSIYTLCATYATKDELSAAEDYIIDMETTFTEAISSKADLVDGKIPSNQLPSYVDDVLEFENKDAFPVNGELDKIYIALDTNLTYRWGGTAYVEISQSLALGETTTTAYAGNKGKKNADDIAALKTQIGDINTILDAINGEII